MAKDDYEVIVCKILIYFYRKLKGKLSEDDLNYYLNPNTKQLPVSESYFYSVMTDLVEMEFIAGVTIQREWGGEVVNISTGNGRITLKGVEYLRSNSTMRKIAETIKEASTIWSLFQI